MDTSHPETLTADARREEVVAILARALVRSARLLRTPGEHPAPQVKEVVMAGYVNECGYRRTRVPGDRRLRMEHVLVWEAAHGPIPDGYEIHHINEDKLDNRLENLQLVTRLEHKRIHGGCELRDGQWWKPCRECGQMQPVEDCYYRRPDGIMSFCKRCTIRKAVEYKRRRRQLARGQAMAATWHTDNAPSDDEAKGGA